MFSQAQRVDSCIATRKLAAGLTAQVIASSASWTEKSLCDGLVSAMAEQPRLHPSGWYDPPASGVSVLFGSSTDSSRLMFDSLRKEEFAASSERNINDETVGLVYLSPVDKATGMIGDLGFTFYRGRDKKVQDRLRQALAVTEDVAEHAAVGMEFRTLAGFAQHVLARSGLKQGEMVLAYDTADVDFGHTIPWSHEDPTPAEQLAIQSSPIDKLKDIIASKRLYLSPEEAWAIPKTCAFTVEPRIIDTDADGTRHLSYYHIIVTFHGGKKRVTANFNPLFKALGMNFIRSRF